MALRSASPRTIARRLGVVAAVGVLLAAALPAGASAATATAPVTAGALTFIGGTPGDITFPTTTLNGVDQFQTQTQAFDVSDATGSSDGWAISATSTTFRAAGHTLSETATTIQSVPPVACDVGSTCTLASNSVSYPYALPAADVAPTATKMFNATAGTGLGNQTVLPTWRLSVPSDTWAGGSANPYVSTWTFTLVSGP